MGQSLNTICKYYNLVPRNHVLPLEDRRLWGLAESSRRCDCNPFSLTKIQKHMW